MDFPAWVCDRAQSGVRTLLGSPEPRTLVLEVHYREYCCFFGQKNVGLRGHSSWPWGSCQPPSSNGFPKSRERSEQRFRCLSFLFKPACYTKLNFPARFMGVSRRKTAAVRYTEDAGRTEASTGMERHRKLSFFFPAHWGCAEISYGPHSPWFGLILSFFLTVLCISAI